MRTQPTVLAGALLVLGVSLTVHAQAGAPATRTLRGGVESAAPGSGFTTVIGSAMRYAISYEQKFALLAAEETSVQELQRPPNPGDNLSQRNPGGGMRAGGEVGRMVIKSDFLLVQLGGDGEGWMPFRDAFEVKGSKRRERDDRLLKPNVRRIECEHVRIDDVDRG